MRKNCIYVN